VGQAVQVISFILGFALVYFVARWYLKYGDDDTL
jgi:hypothetical protein